MATISIVYRKDKINKKGDGPIHFRLIKDRQVSYVSSGQMIPMDHWDFVKNRVKSKHPNSARLNSFLINKFTELQNQVLLHETSTKSLTNRQLKDKIYGKKPSDFIAYAEDILKEYLQNQQIGTYDKNKYVLAKLKEYVENKPLAFQEITVEFLGKYERYLRDVRKNAINTIAKDLKFFRKVFNCAYRADLIEHHLNPFNKYKMKSEKTERSYLTEDELSLIEGYHLTPGTKMDLHRDMFVFASYTGGLRVSDMLLLQWKHFNGTHIDFTIQKTGSQISVLVPNKGIEIIKKYRTESSDNNDFIFPNFSKKPDLSDPWALNIAIGNATAYINKNLNLLAKKVEIEKRISFHTSRHTWATRALRKGISIDKVSKLMGHAAIRETQIYAKLVNSELDKAMDVFN